jgi:transcriptional regulator with PAS, ATPase and Fis domain
MSIYLSYYLDMKKKQNPREKLPSLEEIKKNYVRYLLNVTDNNLKETAKILDVPQTSLEKKIKE